MKTLTEIIELESDLKTRLFKNEASNYLRESIELSELKLELISGKTLPEVVELVKECTLFVPEFAIAIDEAGLIYAIEDICYHGVSKRKGENVYMIESNNSRFTQTSLGYHQLTDRHLIETGFNSPFSSAKETMPVFTRKV